MKSVLIILDSCGVGALPDAHLYDVEPGNTIGNISKAIGGLKLPNLQGLGLGNLTEIVGVEPTRSSLGAYGKMASKTKGKDTTAGHWEMMGVLLKHPLKTFPEGFPEELIKTFEKRIGRLVLGNKVASGTAIIDELGAEHMETGYPIVYTSADSVFQIAAHEDIVPLELLYEWCKIAREILKDEWAVGRVIARPFLGSPDDFVRTANRHDYSLDPVGTTLLDVLVEQEKQVLGIGKIKDIFNGRGITSSQPTSSNLDGMKKTMETINQLEDGLLFVNLVDFDMLYGHRNNPEGYGAALEEVDQALEALIEHCYKEDILLMISADHGNDPTTPDTDHNREYVPILVCGKKVRQNVNLRIRGTFADVAQTLAQYHGVEFDGPGESFYEALFEAKEA